MNVAQDGDRVTVHYTGKFQDGKVFGTSKGRRPLRFRIGDGQVHRPLEDAIVGMSIGDRKTVTVSTKDAFGPRRADLVVSVSKRSFTDGTPEIGTRFSLRMVDGRDLEAIVVSTDDHAVTMDANHPLAGKTLIFDVELVEIARVS